ncbi:hypothetical protein [Anaeromassilibacillus senegalensis]|uniref:Tetratricopeptide repeat protein n=1 Tax=Anaeromassilibacillus senegalensis TaxID=1673717 RepID=A0ABS9CKN9_9FIRM|nr:hypothetical protein [Anaeromassilibacillus senegalensis]MCF2651701.1 hypothetical protein [Anaeromassilibacillus senegalensis]
MGMLSSLFKKDIPQQSHAVEFTKEESSLIKNIPVIPGDSFNQQARKQSIYEQTSMYIQGVAAHFVSMKNYLLAEKLATLSESVAKNAIELHYCYNLWIDLLYKQRDNLEKLNLCIEYCKKDIASYPDFDRANRVAHGNTALHIPSFERLAIIYEKSGDYENAAKINALALSYPNIAKHENYQKRLDKVKAKI